MTTFLLQVALADIHKIGYVRLFGLETEVVKREVQVVTVRSNTALGGSFTLNVTNAQGVSRDTGGTGRLPLLQL